jgi:hypothetical protein
MASGDFLQIRVRRPLINAPFKEGVTIAFSCECRSRRLSAMQKERLKMVLLMTSRGVNYDAEGCA